MQLQIFKYRHEGKLDSLTIVEEDGEAWFVAAEVCGLLEIKNERDAVSRLDDDEKKKGSISDGSKKTPVTLVSESGLYALIFNSTKPEAKKFRKWVTKEVLPAIRKSGGYFIDRYRTPNFVVRYNDNWDRTNSGYFSVISELYIRLYGKFEHLGYLIPDKAFDEKEMRPDVSVGKLFSAYLKKHRPDLADKFTTYKHIFPSKFEVDARQYEVEVLPTFIKFVEEVWLFEHAHAYFKTRDPLALDYLPKLLKGK